MKHIQIQGSDGSMSVSRLVLGTDYFGSGVSKEVAFQILDEYVAAGGNTLDTARVYADWVPGGSGASEQTVGEWLAHSGKRKHVLISTKGGHPRLESMRVGRLNLDDVSRDLEESLRVLAVDRVDLYWLHRDDEEQPVGKLMDMVAAVAETGAVRAFACSNWRAKRIAAANEYADKNGLVRFAASQVQWSLAVSTAEAQEDGTRVVVDDAELAFYRQSRLPIMAYTSQAKGFFSRPLSGPGSANDKSLRWFTNPTNLVRRERVLELSKRTGNSVTAIVLGYVLNQGIEATALIGPRNVAQLRDSMAAANVEPSRDELKFLEDGDEKAPRSA